MACKTAWRLCLAALVLCVPAFGQPDPTWDSFGGTGAISAAAYNPTSEFDRRDITLSGAKLIIPVIASAETSDYGKLYTVLEIANITDSGVDYSLRFLGADGTALSMPVQGSCPTCAVPTSSRQATVGAHGGGQIVILPRNPLKIGWAEFTSDPDASLSVSAMLYAEDTDGTVGRAGIPPTSTYKRAWLYTDNTSDFTTRVILVNPSATEQRTYQLQYRDFSDTGSTCQASVQIAALGEALIETASSLACSSADLGLVEISGDHEFTGIAIVSHNEDGTIFTRPFFERPVEQYPLLERWTVASGTVTYGANTSAGCVAVSDTAIDGVAHTVHASKWQKRADESSPWTDIAGTGRTGMVCAYTPPATAAGQYRGVAEISVGGERGEYSTHNALTVAPAGSGSHPSFGSATASNQSYQAGTAISPLTLPAGSGGDGSLTYSLAPGVPGLSFNAATRVLAGTPTAAGTYALTYTVSDADGDLATLSFVVTVATAQMTTIDLVVSSVTASDDTPGPGQSFDLTAATSNSGTAASAATTVRFYRSTNTTISSSDTQVGTAAVSALAAGGTSSGVLTLTAPSTAGTYYYGACVDRVSGESDSQNNCSSAVSVTVSASQMASAGFDLHADNGSPTGITFANDRFFVVDWDDDKAYAYTAAGQRDAAADFALDSANGTARGIAFANDRFFVVDWDDDKAYAYTAAGQRDAAADFALDSANGVAEGIAFANDRFFVVDRTAAKVYAYTAAGQRDAASDFALDSASGGAKGIAFANDRFYVVDNGDDKVYAYTAAGQREPAADFALDSANGIATGITFANDRFYVVDWDDKVYAYTAAGQHEPVADSQPSFGAATVGNQSYQAGTAISPLTLPAATGGDGTLTYSLAPGVPGLSFNSTTRQLTGTPTAAGTYALTYTVSDADGDLATLSFVVTVATAQLTTIDLVVSSVTASDDTPGPGQSFDLTAATSNSGTAASAATTVRFYRSTNTTISSSDTEVGTAAVGALAAGGTGSSALTLTAPSTAGTYYYGACVDRVSGESNSQNNCSSAVTVTVSASQMASAGFELHADNGSPIGITFANDRFFVVDFGDDKVYGYHSSGQRDAAADFALDSANGNAAGITFANNRFFVADWDDVKVYAYQSSGQRDAAADFDLDSANVRASGITFANDRFFVVDFGDAKVYAYHSSGQRDAAADFALDSATRRARGITFANNRFFVVDRLAAKVYAYTAAGQRDAAADFALDSASGSAQGITFANNRLFVVDFGDAKVYAYPAGAGPGTTDSQPSFGSATASNQSYQAGTAISPLTLSAATGGDGTLTYSLAPGVPGLSFNSTTRQLTGTPTTAGTHSMTYTVRDADGDASTLRFTITVQAGGGDDSDTQWTTGQTITSMPTGFWFGSVGGSVFFRGSGGIVLITFGNGGWVEYSSRRWTCASAGGCDIRDRELLRGTIVETAAP